MKKLSRLTALLLAIAVLMTGMPLMALADSITVDIDTWNSWVEEAQNAAANQTETVTTTVPVTGETSVVDRPVVEAALTAHAGTETGATQAVSLPIAGKLVLKAFDGASSYQWQVKAGSQWANIVGDKGATVTLTYAKIQNAISGGAAQVRCVMVVDGQDYVSATAQVTVDETVTYTTVETESTLTVTSEVPVRSNYALRNNGATTYDGDDTTTSNDTASTVFNVTIKYLFDTTKKEAAAAKVFQLLKGTAYNATVNSPVVVGYTADQASVTIAYDGVTLPAQEITVYYKPAEVTYTVKHYKQNLENDEYTLVEDDTEVLQGYTESPVTVTPKEYTGYVNLLYETPAIAANGSTVVEVYYDRSYFLMNFDLDGGYGVEPIYARYGAPIGNVGTPTKAGYSFVEWTPKLPSTMPAENRTYKAIWQADDTAKVTVVFWGENADDEEYSYIKSAQVNVKPGTEFTYNESGSLVCGQEEHTHKLTNNCYELTCTKEVHNHIDSACKLNCTHIHGLACYSTSGEFKLDNNHGGKSESEMDNLGNGLYRYSTGFLGGNKHYYVKIGNNWYCSSKGNKNEISFKCIHTVHDDSCYTCGQIQTEHTHSIENGCYMLTCTKTEHSHKSDCYMSGAGLDSNLWTFVRSDTVTVAADGSSVVNVYYDRTEFTLTFHYNYGYDSYRSSGTIKAKWGADIGTRFLAMNESAKGNLWSREDNGDSPWTSYLQIMPQEDRKYYYNRSGSYAQAAEYYTETLTPGQYEKAFTVTAYYNSTLTISAEDFYPMEGFTYDHGTDGEGDSMPQPGSYGDFAGAKFYYTRNAYDIEFFNPTSLIKKVEDVPYQSPLGSYDFIPGDEWVPEKYEPGSVVFEGWYLNPECSGEKYVLSAHTMPVGPVKNETSLSLYAKWVPVMHTVEFYLDKAALDAGTKLSTHKDITVSHGSKANPTPATPTNGGYTFVGWFYMDNGVEKAFDFANMPVNKDLQVYGKWSSNVLVDYTIQYIYVDEDGNSVAVADPITGEGLATYSKTFEAKYGPELYDAYSEGYFPTVASQNLVLSIPVEGEANPNVLTFYYVSAKVPYTVKYLEKDTGRELHAPKVVSDNTKSYVTETFEPISSYVPDAVQKSLRLYVTEDKDGNIVIPSFEIIFYYTKNPGMATYTLNYYKENASGGFDLMMYTSDIGYTDKSNQTPKKVAAEPDKYSAEHYIYDDARTTYQVGSNPPASYTGELTLTQDGLVINHYYVEDTAKIYYVAVGPEGLNADGTPKWTVAGEVSPDQETLKVLSGTAQGSKATANENYKFVGWYTDADCETSVESTWVDANNKITPFKESGAAWVNGTTYYAKFVVDKAALTIEKTGMDSGESAIINVSGPGYDGKVVVPNGESVTLFVTCGEYTITEVGSWTNRYTTTVEGLKDDKVTLEAKGATVTFKNTKVNDKWLHDESAIENFTKTGTSN